eukprot:6208696-Pleurochrysis_carterae.AAC.1
MRRERRAHPRIGRIAGDCLLCFVPRYLLTVPTLCVCPAAFFADYDATYAFAHADNLAATYAAPKLLPDPTFPHIPSDAYARVCGRCVQQAVVERRDRGKS